MPPRSYRKRPVVIEAWQLRTDNGTELADWCGGSWMTNPDNRDRDVIIETLEGVMVAQPGDWIIKGVAGEFYPCRADIFAATYELAFDCATV